MESSIAVFLLRQPACERLPTIPSALNTARPRRNATPLARSALETRAEIQQLALIGSCCSLHSEACNALGASDGVTHGSIYREATCLRAAANG